MSQRAYISNISPLWPIDRQLAMLADTEFTSQVFRDEITKSERRSQKMESLPERGHMLRATSRNRPETILVASLACLAFNTDDFIYVLTQASERNATIQALDSTWVFPPCKKHADLLKAAKIFADNKARAKGFQNGQLGGMTSGANKQAKVKAAAELARPFWHLDEPSNIALAKKVGASVNALKDILGTREDARRKYQAVLKRKAKNAGAA